MPKMPMRSLALAAALAAVGSPADAQNRPSLRFAEGRVSVSAVDVPMRTLLEDWSRLGQTRIVNLDRVATTPISVTLDNVPEAEALEIIMRSAAGYVAAPRAVRMAGASTFDRILVMPPSASGDAPAAGGARRGAGTDPSARQRTARGTGAAANDPVPMPDGSDSGADAPFGQPFGQPVDNPFQANPFANMAPAPAFGQPTPFGTPVLPGPTPPPLFGPVDGSGAVPAPTQNPFLQLTPMQPSGAPPAPATVPTNGLGGSTTPGMVVPATPPATGSPGRPPGGA